MNDNEEEKKNDMKVDRSIVTTLGKSHPIIDALTIILGIALAIIFIFVVYMWFLILIWY